MTGSATTTTPPSNRFPPALSPARLRQVWGGRSSDWRLGLLVGAACSAVSLLWWVAFFPGLTSYDTAMYVWQATTDNWSTSHSVLYNALLWVSLQLTGSLWLLTFAQAMTMAGGLAYTVVGLRRLGVRARWLVVAAVAAIALPAIGTFTIYVSKDVAFVLCQVWLVGTVARLLIDVRGRLLWTLLVELTLITLFRPNGFLIVVITAVLLVLVLKGVRWRLVGAAAGAIAIGFVTTFGLYPALGVRPAGSELLLGPAYADLAVAFNERPSAFSAADRSLLATVAPLEYWRDSANCYVADDTVSPGGGTFSMDAARAHSGELLGLWFTVLGRAPDVITEARLCRGSIGWNPFPGPPQGRTVKVPINRDDGLFDFPPNRIAQSRFASALTPPPAATNPVHRAGVWLRGLSDTNTFEWFAWRGAFWAYVAYLSVFLFARRRGWWAPLALVAVIVANQLTVIVNNPNQLMRYMAGPMILGILLLPLLFARPSTSARVDHVPRGT